MHRGFTGESPVAVSAQSSHGSTNESELVPVCFFVSRFSQLLLSSRQRQRLRPAEMMTDVHAHLNDGWRTTVTTTVIHDHVDLRNATHHLVSAAYACPCTRRVQANPRASVRMSDRESFLDRPIKSTQSRGRRQRSKVKEEDSIILLDHD